MIKGICICCFLLPAFSIHSQNIWYFGNGAGISFSSADIQPIYDAKIFTNEGCAAASDEKGNLLFYTDGITVWSQHHSVFKNGDGLYGSKSSAQSALIVPFPNQKKNSGKYYIFTVDEKAGKKGLCFSVADYKTQSVGIKNKLLLKNSTEKLTAVLHQNGKDVWLIAHEWGTINFYSWRITESEIQRPVISSVGVANAETGAGENREAIGCLRASSTGKKLASSVCYRSRNNLEIFDFDNATGKVSNPVPVPADGFPYGLCFSPSGSKLYISFLKGKFGIMQYDLTDKSIIKIANNEKENSFGGMQLGPDGKIYVARTGNFLDRIQSPDEKGISCVYEKNAIDLSPSSSTYGLPEIFIYTSAASDKSEESDCAKILEKPFSRNGQLVTTEISVCDSTYILDAKNAGAAYRWSAAKAITQKITVDTSGMYRVAITKAGCTATDSIRVHFRKDLAVFRYLHSFNPESEFVNSDFYYSIDEVRDFHLIVFDIKRKHILFETNNINKRWNGKNRKGIRVPDGEYPFSVRYIPKCPPASKIKTLEGKIKVRVIK